MHVNLRKKNLKGILTIVKSNLISMTLDHDANWCPSNQSTNRQQNSVQSTSYKDPNYNQVATTNENGLIQSVSADNHNSLVGSLLVNPNSMENARLQHDYNISQMFSSNVTINDLNRESSIVNEVERGAELQPRSITTEYESIPSIENKDCEYLKLVMAFKRTLVLPDVFFSYDMAVCYCAACLSSGRNLLEGNCKKFIQFINLGHSATGDFIDFIFFFFMFYCRLGWVRFKLSHMVTNASSSASSDSVDCSGSDWTTAYYMSRVDKIRAILDHGQPLPIGNPV